MNLLNAGFDWGASRAKRKGIRMLQCSCIASAKCFHSAHFLFYLTELLSWRTIPALLFVTNQSLYSSLSVNGRCEDRDWESTIDLLLWLACGHCGFTIDLLLGFPCVRCGANGTLESNTIVPTTCFEEEFPSVAPNLS